MKKADVENVVIFKEHLKGTPLLIKWCGKIPMRHLSDGSEMSMDISFETYLRRHWYAPKDVVTALLRHLVVGWNSV